MSIRKNTFVTSVRDFLKFPLTVQSGRRRRRGHKSYHPEFLFSIERQSPNGGEEEEEMTSTTTMTTAML